MKRVMSWTLGSVLFASSGILSAVPLTFSDTVDPASDVCLSQTTSNLCAASATSVGPNYSFIHDLTDDGLLTADTISSASLVIEFRDDGDTPAEKVDVALDLSHIFNNQGAAVDFSFDFEPAFAVLSDGLLSVNLHRQNGDFFFANSVLTVVVERNSRLDGGAATQVPEPATLFLLGAGFVGLTLASRRRKED